VKSSSFKMHFMTSETMNSDTFN